MRNQLILWFLCISIISFSGCFVPAFLHPVDGPATIEESHTAVIKPSGAFSSGKFYADLQEDRVLHGDECRGRWKAAAPPVAPAANDMVSAWDTAYGKGYYTAQILKAKKCARGSGACKEGRILDAEICLFENKQTRKTTRVGVARDNKKNIYTLIF